MPSLNGVPNAAQQAQGDASEDQGSFEDGI